MSTLVGSLAKSGVQPRFLHAGVNSQFSVYSLTATLSAGDIIQMMKLPDGARVIDAILSTAVRPGEAGTLNVGDRADHDRLIASADASAVIAAQHINTAIGVGHQYDISDAASPRYTMIEIKASDFTGSGTNSGAISLAVMYQLDD
jgi:hypothetical protein